MAIRFVLSDYVGQAMALAAYDKLEDGAFAGRIPPCKGVVAFGATLRECEEELRSTLEDCINIGVLIGLIVRQIEAGPAAGVRSVQAAYHTGAVAYALWGMFLVVATPWVF